VDNSCRVLEAMTCGAVWPDTSDLICECSTEQAQATVVASPSAPEPAPVVVASPSASEPVRQRRETRENVYSRTSGVGAWGGWCTCPDGQRYQVGDKFDACAQGPQSLACIGGTPGECEHRVDAAREGHQVVCAAP